MLVFRKYFAHLRHRLSLPIHTIPKMMFSIKDFFINVSKFSFLQIWTHLLRKYLMENVIFCAVSIPMRENTEMKMYQTCSMPL